MGNKKKPIAWILFGLYLAWTLLVQPVWNLNVERIAERNKIDGALVDAVPMMLLRDIVSYLPSSFAAGFVTGALLFAYWDNIVAAFKRYVLRRQLDAVENEALVTLWVGRIEAHVGNMEYDGRFRLILSVLNFGQENVALSKISGAITARTTLALYKLDPLVIEPNNPITDGLAPGHWATVVLAQYVPSEIAGKLFEATQSTKGVVLDLRNVDLVFNSKSNSEGVRVDLRHGLRLRRGYEYVGSQEISFDN